MQLSRIYSEWLCIGEQSTWSLARKYEWYEKPPGKAGGWQSSAQGDFCVVDMRVHVVSWLSALVDLTDSRFMPLSTRKRLACFRTIFCSVA